MIRTDLIDTKYLHNTILEMMNNDNSKLATSQQQAAQVQETCTNHSSCEETH